MAVACERFVVDTTWQAARPRAIRPRQPLALSGHVRKSAQRTIGNSPALQCWGTGASGTPRPVKRAKEYRKQHFLSSAPRTCDLLFRSIPSDESLGYFRSSAQRTEIFCSFIYTLAQRCSFRCRTCPASSMTARLRPLYSGLRCHPRADIVAHLWRYFMPCIIGAKFDIARALTQLCGVIFNSRRRIVLVALTT